MAFDLSEIGTLAQMVAEDPKLQMELWSEAVKADARDMNPLKDFVGKEGSGMPIIEKSEKIQGGQKVYFSTRAPVLGRGVMGSAELKSKTAKMRHGSFGVTVDLRRFAISEEQLVEYFTLPGNSEKNRGEVMLELSREWWVRTQCDDYQMVLRNKARFATGTPNLLRVGAGADVHAITVSDTYDTGTIEDGKHALIGLGAKPMAVSKDKAGTEIPQFLVFGPDECTSALENEQKFREAIHNNQARGDESLWFSGKYPLWKNNLIFRHNLIFDAGPNRQGSPLLPRAYLGAAIASGAATVVTGGGAWNTDAALTDTVLYDFFSYFGGYGWKTHENETLPADTGDYYFMIYNVSGADRGKYEICKYAGAQNNGNRLLVVTREMDEVGITQKTILDAAGRYTNVHPSGSLIIPCNKYGVPYGYVLHLASEALLVGKGALEADPIRWGDDFESMTSGQEHIRARGIQSIIGYSPSEDTLGRYPNFVLVECAVEYPELDLVDIRAAL